MLAHNLKARFTKNVERAALQGSHRRIIHSSRSPHTFTPFHALSLDPFQFRPQAFQLALEPLALLLGISNLLRNSKLPGV